MGRRLLCAAITMTGFVVSACATMQVSSHVERGLDFSQYPNLRLGSARQASSE